MINKIYNYPDLERIEKNGLRSKPNYLYYCRSRFPTGSHVDLIFTSKLDQ